MGEDLLCPDCGVVFASFRTENEVLQGFCLGCDSWFVVET
jgi:hypothetical protein